MIPLDLAMAALDRILLIANGIDPHDPAWRKDSALAKIAACAKEAGDRLKAPKATLLAAKLK